MSRQSKAARHELRSARADFLACVPSEAAGVLLDFFCEVHRRVLQAVESSLQGTDRLVRLNADEADRVRVYLARPFHAGLRELEAARADLAARVANRTESAGE